MYPFQEQHSGQKVFVLTKAERVVIYSIVKRTKDWEVWICRTRVDIYRSMQRISPIIKNGSTRIRYFVREMVSNANDNCKNENPRISWRANCRIAISLR